MKLARYWTRETADATGPDGNRIRVVSRGWSNESLEGAKQRARDSARKLATALASGQIERHPYLYGDRPLPEPVIREFGAAVVTKNSYGSLVLNTSNLMFIDIDREDRDIKSPAGDLISSVLSLFGAKPAPAPLPATTVAEDIGRIAERKGLSVRVYKTAAGHRAIVTNASIEAGSAQAQALLLAFAADPLYIRLCRAQESFRARLTPKPWRCGVGLPPSTFPFTTAAEESQYRAWEAKYTSASGRYATCQYVCAFGGRTAPDLEELILYHDQETRCTSGLALA